MNKDEIVTILQVEKLILNILWQFAFRNMSVVNNILNIFLLRQAQNICSDLIKII